ncbi:DUF397 domain-containing protein [Actinoalloteichus sp. AHMU CJ021]|uniref:DUF397 domain-containing protein n=1 Tax=Actinoalloteichus caeruleus DSM 43889 TaxID=1120930 RepID=A0ABT1JHX0_ACTCY|nr:MULTISPECIES: DUF397 domain-containing protein [Actinoalloteichus]AUS81523.1 DUF397 domain-containing protein [Actinoalloteichus sp. AHMU CJ021]MCP2332109.1 protein of unknown function (DUF397) [Actinoalloteichus caeruleus DSM 43889]
MWRTSTRSGVQANCVEIGTAASVVVGIRDTKNRDGGTLLLPRTAFAALVDAVKADRLR